MKQTALQQTAIFAVLLSGLATFFGCSSNTGTPRARIYPHRAFISNLTSSRIDIADTSRDLLVTAISADLPGKLLLSNDKKYTLALSPQTNSISFAVNSSQSTVASTTLAGPSESFAIAVDDSLILAAVPGESGPIGQAPGAVDVITVSSSTTTSGTSINLTRQPSIFLPGAKFLSGTPNTNTFLAFGDAIANPANPGSGAPTGRLWAIKTSLVNGNTQPYVEVVSALWDHPVAAIATAADTAYVLNCGPECGGQQASIVKLDLSPQFPSPPTVAGQLLLPSGATTAFLNGNTLYVAGSQPNGPCPASTPAIPPFCGTLTPVDLTTFTAGTPVFIPGGTHQNMTLGANNLLFVGSRGCTVVTVTMDPANAAGCLAMVDLSNFTQDGVKVAPPTVFIAPATGPGNDDVTGMTPIANRNEVYVIEAEELVIYDTKTKAVKILSTPSPNIIGQAVDVVAIDF